MERSPWYREQELAEIEALKEMPSATVDLTPPPVWVELYNALRRNTDYAVVTTVDDHWTNDAGTEVVLSDVRIDHTNKKIELEFG